MWLCCVQNVLPAFYEVDGVGHSHLHLSLHQYSSAQI